MTGSDPTDKQAHNEKAPVRVAVALHYEPGVGQAPKVTAKGEGHMAERIIEVAKEHNVAIEHNPLLAQALSQLPIDEQIPPELYKAVAEVMRFVLGFANRPGAARR